jgi:hypothetical protein
MNQLMNQKVFKVLAAITLIFQLQACAKKTSTAAICGASGMFADAAECQANAGSGSCVPSTAQSDTGQAVCYRLTQNQNSTSTGTGPGIVASCNPSYNESISPSVCSSAQPVQTVTRYCKAGCTCSFGTTQQFTQNCTADLYQSLHYSGDCTSAGGTVEFVDGKKGCAFNGSSCANGWNQLKNNGYAYTITEAARGQNWVSCTPPSTYTYTNYHSTFQAVAPECKSICSSRDKCGGLASWGECVSSTICSTVKKILCY